MLEFVFLKVRSSYKVIKSVRGKSHIPRGIVGVLLPVLSIRITGKGLPVWFLLMYILTLESYLL